MVFNNTFTQYFSFISGENHRPAASHWQLSHIIIMLYRIHIAWAWFKLTTLVVICTGLHC